jgi:phage terminase large subunit-like protein
MAATFRNLYLNQRVSASEHFISPEVWKTNGADPDIGAFDDCICYGGLDLSGKNDLTALIMIATDDSDITHVMPFFFTPADNLKDRSDRDKVPYSLWVSQEFLIAVPGKTIDYRYVAQKLGELHGRMKIGGIKFDRWRIADLQRDLIAEGVESWIDGQDVEIPGGLRLVPHGQGFKDMSPAVERLEDILIKGSLRHGNHPVLTMCAANTRVQSDPAGGRKFDKLKSTGRIDGTVALAMAISASVETPLEEVSVYESRGVLSY